MEQLQQFACSIDTFKSTCPMDSEMLNLITRVEVYICLISVKLELTRRLGLASDKKEP